MIVTTTLGIIALVVGGVAVLWAGAKFKNWLVALPLVGKFFA